MRGLDEEFEKELIRGKFKGVIDYVKSQEDVFLGVRENYINLYVDGGSFFKLEYSHKKGYRASMDRKYYNPCPDRIPPKLKDINEKRITNIEDWIQLFPELKKVVKEYQEQKLPGIKKKREKILQQKLVHEFNKNSNYFAYDIEYAIKGATDYIYDADHHPLGRKPKTEGRADILLISKPVNDKVSIYFMEVKEGINSFSGVTDKKDGETLGSGIIGHLKNNVKIINLVRNNELYKSTYREERYPKNPAINIREILLEEVRNIMSFYQKAGLIENKNFKDIEDYKKINLKDQEEAIKLVFFLGDYRKGSKSFENYLGIHCDKEAEAKYSVRKLFDNKEKENLNLDYISSKDMIDFKYLKTSKSCDDQDFELEIEANYEEIKKEEFQKRS